MDHVLLRRDLAAREQDVRVVEHGGLVVDVGHEVRGDVALVEAHALGELKVQTEAVVVLDGHHTILADLVERLGDLLADLGIGCGDRRGRGDLLLGLHRLGRGHEFLDDRVGGLLDATAQRDRVRTGHNILEAFVHKGLGQHGRGGGAIAGHIVGLLGDFLDELGADALERVFKIDFLGDRHTIVGDGRRTIGLVEHHVAALRSQRHLDGIGELVETRQHALTCFLIIFNDLCHCSSTMGLMLYDTTRDAACYPTVSFRVSLPRSECYYGRVALSTLECQLDMQEFALSARDANARNTAKRLPGIYVRRAMRAPTVNSAQQRLSPDTPWASRRRCTPHGHLPSTS